MDKSSSTTFPIAIVAGPRGSSTCSACGGYVRRDATACKHCHARFTLLAPIPGKRSEPSVVPGLRRTYLLTAVPFAVLAALAVGLWVQAYYLARPVEYYTRAFLLRSTWPLFLESAVVHVLLCGWIALPIFSRQLTSGNMPATRSVLRLALSFYLLTFLTSLALLGAWQFVGPLLVFWFAPSITLFFLVPYQLPVGLVLAWHVTRSARSAGAYGSHS